ncbi:F-box domain-containing protein [Pleurotus pulmonarius]
MSTSWIDSRILALPVDLAWMLISAVLKIPRWVPLRSSHTGLLRSLEALFWQRPKSLEDMPFDVIFGLSFHLSVKDICSLRATSRQLRHLVQNRSLWLLVLRDILEIRPIPRLSYALDDMSLEELMKATIRLNALDKKIRGLDPDVKLTQVGGFDAHRAAILVPGGRHFVTIAEPKLDFFIHDFRAKDLSAGRPFLPHFEHRVMSWHMVPVGATIVNVAVATLDLKSYAVDHNGHRLPRSYVHVFRCDIGTNSWEQIDYFYIDARFENFYFDSQFIAMMWQNIGSDHSQAKFRAYVRRESTPILNLVDIGYEYSTGIVIIDQCHFVVASHNIARLFRLPTFYPIVGASAAETTVDHRTIWRSANEPTLTSLRPPFVANLLPFQVESLSSLPPAKWVFWNGDYWYIVTRSLNAFEYDLECQRLLPGRDQYTVLHRSVGKFSAMATTSDGEFFTFPLPINYNPSSRGFARLDARLDFHDEILLKKVAVPQCEEEIWTVVSHDEESGHILFVRRALDDSRGIIAAALT